MKKDLMYIAIPVVRDGQTKGVLRTSMPIASVVVALKSTYLKIGFLVAIISLVAVVVSLMVSKWINKPIREMIEGVNHFTGGDLNYRIPISTSGELRSLAESMNVMAAQLDERIRTITEQRNEFNAILSGMVEAVFAVTKEGTIIEYNQAAQKLFDSDFETVRGKHIREVIRNAHLQAFIYKSLVEHEFVDEEVFLYDEDERVLQAHGTQILDAEGEPNGAIIVLNDITHMKKLENVRRDFVANVSHELKTPITSIIGFVETLKDGAIKDTKNREQFLNIILKHAERLNGIIEDLLSLSRIEKNTENGKIADEKIDLCEILANSISFCEHSAVDKGIIIKLECKDLSIHCNPTMIEQAVVNLIENAVKYSDRGSAVTVKMTYIDKEVIIDVIDTGCGIPQEHLSRIFERFYRVDKGRSRELGGTGLGLAIVKHIVIAHKGRVTVESKPGKGSTFSIILPSH